VIERDAAPVIKHDLHAGRIHVSYGAERSVLHPETTFVAQEHDPVAGCKGSLAADHIEVDVLAKLTGFTHPRPRRVIERPHFIVGMREDDAAARRLLLPIATPASDQLLACLLARGSRMDMASLVVGGDCLSCSFGCELARRIALPVLALPANGGDLCAAMPLGDRAERCPCLDRLELFDI